MSASLALRYKIEFLCFLKNIIFGRHKNLKQQNSRCFKETTTTNIECTNRSVQHDSHTDMDRAALCGAGMLEKCFFAAYGLAQEKHRKISFVSCLRSRYRARERKRERRKASRISGYVQALCRSCLSFMHNQSRRTID